MGAIVALIRQRLASVLAGRSYEVASLGEFLPAVQASGDAGDRLGILIGKVGDHRISIVSSRLGRRLDRKTWWFDTLRTAAMQIDRNRESLLAVEGTATFEYVKRAAELFEIDRLLVRTPDHRIDGVEKWLDRTAIEIMKYESVSLESCLWISPVVTGNTCADGGYRVSFADEFSIRAVRRVVCIDCRKGGTIERTLQQVLDGRTEDAPIVVVHDRDSADSASGKLIESGAVAWHQQPVERSEATVVGASRDTRASPGCPPNTGGPLTHPENWLCHWTRATTGEWSDRSRNEFLDQLILGDHESDRSALATLLRMIGQKRIRGTTSSAGAIATVSFTEVGLTEFRERRIFRRHKQRYDFESWGIAIRRSSLEQSGARAVRYVDEDSAQASEEKPEFVQRATNRNGSVDWRAEREWRFPGDVELATFNITDVVVFVDSRTDAEIVRRVSVWSVVVVPDSADKES